MRKSILSLALIMASYASAGDKQPYHLNIHTGMTVFDDSSYLENGSLVGVSASFYEKERQTYALQLGYDRLSGIAYENIVLDTDITRYYANLLVDGEEELSITPYIILGGGYEALSRVYEEYTQTKSQAFITAGLGFKYRLNDYVNITLEGSALGKIDSESIDYGGKLGLDLMFGGKWSKKRPQLEALGEPKVIEPQKEKPMVKKAQAKKKPKWITPEVVEEMFSEKNQEKSVLAPKNDAINIMQENLKALKLQMAQNEALLAAKLAKLENDLVLKRESHAQAMQNQVRQEDKEQKRLLVMKMEAEAQHTENMKIAKAKIAQAKQMAQALEEKSVQKHLALKKEKEKQRLENEKLEVARKSAIEKSKQALEAKRVEDKKREELARAKLEQERMAEEKIVAKQERIQVAKEQAEYERLRLVQEKEEKKLAEIAEQKVQQEETDRLYIRNGMVVFAD